MTPVEFEIKKRKQDKEENAKSRHRPKCSVSQELVSRLQGHDRSISYPPKFC